MVDVNEETFLMPELLAETNLPRFVFFNLQDYNFRATLYTIPSSKKSPLLLLLSVMRFDKTNCGVHFFH
jgi:hypothetical protein